MTAARITAGALAVAGAAADRWAARTRATHAEARQPLRGDELVPDPMWQATRAVTINVPPDAVWPWLVQMGYPTHRAGWYTPYWLDRLVFGIRVHSATKLLQQFQDLEVGDLVLDGERGNSYFVAARVDAPDALVLHSHTHPLPVYRDTNFSWAFVSQPHGDGTRLLMRARITYTPSGPAPLVHAMIAVGFGAGDLLQAGSMLLGIKQRAERLGATPQPIETSQSTAHA
jgi:hypothetical protein